MKERFQIQTTSKKPRNQVKKRAHLQHDTDSADNHEVKPKKAKIAADEIEVTRTKPLPNNEKKVIAVQSTANSGKKQNMKRKSNTQISEPENSKTKHKKIESHINSNVLSPVQKSRVSKQSTPGQSPVASAPKHGKIKPESASKSKTKPDAVGGAKAKKQTATQPKSDANAKTKTTIKTSGSTCKSTSKSKRLKEKDAAVGSEEKKKSESPKKKEKKNHQVQPVSTVTPVALDVSDPLKMLMMMEGIGGNAPGISDSSPTSLACLPSTSSSQKMNEGIEGDSSNEGAGTMSNSESEGMSDWEEVCDHSIAPERSQIPDKPVEITLDLPDILKHKKRKKKTFDWKAYIKRRVRRFKKDVAMDMHKVHLLCLLSLGMQQNDLLNDPVLRGVILSLLPSQFTTKTKASLDAQVENLLLWYKRKFTLEKVTHCSDIRLVTASSLLNSISNGSITDARIWVLIFICLLRTIGLTVRMVLSFQPIPFKGAQGSDEKKGKKGQQSKNSSKSKSTGKGGTPKTSAAAKPAPKCSSKESSSSSSKNSKTPLTKQSTTQSTTPTVKRRPSARESSKKAVLKNRASLEGSDDGGDEDEEFSEEEMKNMKKVKRKSAEKKKVTLSDEPSSETEFEETSIYFASPHGLKKDLKILSNRKVLSPSTSDDEVSRKSKPQPTGHDFWLEVYFPDKKKWICFDCFKSKFGKPYSLESSATQPLTYVLGFNNVGWVKDVTARYAKQWLSYTRKNRIDQEWWEDTLYVFDQTPHQDKVIEEDEIKSQLLVRPIPTSIGEFKGHPLYALRRHLLKFEAIYPETAIPMGYIRKEPIFARECVRTLHSRDNWVKEGRLVRLNESPYKMVKSRPKWNKPKENPNELDLELFGEWQTEIYIPPPAVDGKVPRNAYGNVELFKDWMLPKGTVQVRGQGVQRVAKKLGIDVAPAMIGWDHHSGYPHPVMDGFIVCEEFEDTLMAAIEEDVEIQKQREIEKKEKRVYGNWKVLIRGLLIKQRLTNKFLQEKPLIEEKVQEETFSDGEVAVDVQQSWPQNRKEEKKKKQIKTDKLKSEKIEELIGKELKKEASDADEDVLETKPLLGKGKKVEITTHMVKTENNKKPAGRGRGIMLDKGGKNALKGGKAASQKIGSSKIIAMSQISNKPVVRKIANFESSDSEQDFEDVSDADDVGEDKKIGESQKLKPKAEPDVQSQPRPSRSARLRRSSCKINYNEGDEVDSDAAEKDSGEEFGEESEEGKKKTAERKGAERAKKGRGVLDLSEGNTSEEDSEAEFEEEVKVSKKKTSKTNGAENRNKGKGVNELVDGSKNIRGRRRNLKL